MRALAGIRARPMSSVVAALGLFVAGAILGGAITTRGSLSSGFERAQQAAGSADVVARFDPVERNVIAQRVATLANIGHRSPSAVDRPSAGNRGWSIMGISPQILHSCDRRQRVVPPRPRTEHGQTEMKLSSASTPQQ